MTIPDPPVTGQELPLVCSLAPAELEERKQLIRDIAAAGVLGVERGDSALEVRFSESVGLRESLEALIQLEATCCPFLQFGLSERDGVLSLSVEAPGGADTALDAIRHMLASPA